MTACAGPAREGFIGRQVTIPAIAVLSVLTLFTAVILNLAPDEAYYWYWSRYPELGYFDHPPMVAYLIAATTAMGGDSEFFVRLGALVLFFSGQYLVFRTVRILFPERPGTLAWEVVLLINLTLLLPGIGMLITVDSPLIFFWTAALYSGARIITGGNARWWYAMGLALGAGLLSKYTMVLLVPCVFSFLLFSRRHRHWLRRREPWLALLLAVLVFSPALAWNWQHHWISFAFQIQQGFASVVQPAGSRLLEYLALQAGVASPPLFALMVFYGAAGLGIAVRRHEYRYLYLFLLSWPVIMFFGLTSVVGERAEGNWAAPGHVAGIILAWTVFRLDYACIPAHRAATGFLVIVALVINVLVRIHLLYPILPLPPSGDPLRQFSSWKELGREIGAQISRHPSKAGYFLVSDRGTRLAEALFYTGGRHVGVDLFRPERYLFLTDVDAALRGRDAIILAGLYRDAVRDYTPYFRSVEPAGAYTQSYRGETFDEYSAQILIGRDFLGNWRQLNPLPGP